MQPEETVTEFGLLSAEVVSSKEEDLIQGVGTIVLIASSICDDFRTGCTSVPFFTTQF